MKPYVLTLIACLLYTIVAAQQLSPPYTKKKFVADHDTTEFKSTTGTVKNGIVITYIKTTPSFYDVDDNNTTHIKGSAPALLRIESTFKNGKRNGPTKHYLIDAADHSRHYLIWEQTYVNDHLNGVWNTYNLKGTLVQYDHFKDDSLHGISRRYWIDGKSIMEEQEYFNGRGKFIHRNYFKNGKIASEVTYTNEDPNGEAKEYYETGVLKDKFNLKKGLRDGLRIYYYPDGKPWIEEIYKENKPWTIVANYDSKGNKRKTGTLKDGNGTVIYYDDDVTVRETIQYKNGEEQKQ